MRSKKPRTISWQQLHFKGSAVVPVCRGGTIADPAPGWVPKPPTRRLAQGMNWERGREPGPGLLRARLTPLASKPRPRTKPREKAHHPGVPGKTRKLRNLMRSAGGEVKFDFGIKGRPMMFRNADQRMKPRALEAAGPSRGGRFHCSRSSVPSARRGRPKACWSAKSCSAGTRLNWRPPLSRRSDDALCRRRGP